MDDLERTQLEQILRLTKENNQMLRAMRRNAWIAGFFRVVIWIALIVIPYYLYLVYLAPVMEGMMETIGKIQGTSAQAQAQFGSLNDALQKLQQLQSQFPQFFQGR